MSETENSVEEVKNTPSASSGEPATETAVETATDNSPAADTQADNPPAADTRADNPPAADTQADEPSGPGEDSASGVEKQSNTKPAARPDDKAAAQPTNDPNDPQSDTDSQASSLYCRLRLAGAKGVGSPRNLLQQQQEASRQRQAAVRDVRFLENRLKRLKLEQEKTSREVKHLRQRTHTMDETRRANHDRKLTAALYGKTHVAALESERLEKERRYIAWSKEQHAKTMELNRQKILHEKQESAAKLRRLKERNNVRLNMEKEDLMEKHHKSRELVIAMHKASREKREQDLAARRNEIKQYAARQMEVESYERERQERIAAALAAREAEMVYQLQKLHKMKHRAQQNLAERMFQTPTPSQHATSHPVSARGDVEDDTNGLPVRLPPIER